MNNINAKKRKLTEFITKQHIVDSESKSGNNEMEFELEFHIQTLFPFLHTFLFSFFPKDLIRIVCEYSFTLWLSPLQEEALKRAVINRENLYIGGAGGVGKSHLLKLIYKEMIKKGLNIGMTATTGLASTLLPNGVSTNSFCGIGYAEDAFPVLLKRARAPWVAARWRSCQVLFIDEVSMMKPYILELIDKIAQHIRGNNKPFGGIQLITCGDFCQLPPVYKTNEKKYQNLTFAFEHELWKKYLGPKNTIYLRDVYRQNEKEVYDSLNRLRLAEPTDGDDAFWCQQIRSIPEELKTEIIRLCGTNKEAETINMENLNKKCPRDKCEWKIFNAISSIVADSGNKKTRESAGKKDLRSRLVGAYLDNMTKHCLARTELTLAAGAKVMLVVNLDPPKKLINGTCGKIIDFKHGNPVVEFEVTGADSKEKEIIIRVIEMYYWKYEVNGELLATYGQIPLLLAWAITIHKSQGMSLKDMSVNVSKSFAFGQSYCALSRMKSLKDAIITGYDPRAFQIHPKVKEFELSLLKIQQQN